MEETLIGVAGTRTGPLCKVIGPDFGAAQVKIS